MDGIERICLQFAWRSLRAFKLGDALRYLHIWVAYRWIR